MLMKLKFCEKVRIINNEYFHKLCIRTERQLLRIDAVRRSPINSHVDESLAGTTSIRAFNAQDRFIQKMDQLVDDSQAVYYISFIVLRCKEFHNFQLVDLS